jgi:hypothetical protein
MLKRLILAGIMAAPLSVMAVTIQGQASATVEQPIAVVQATPIQFGSVFDTTGHGGTVDLDANGAATPDAASGLRTGGATSAGSFNVTAAANSHYEVAINPAQFNITRAGGAETMGVDVSHLRFSSDAGNLYGTHALLAGQTDGGGLGNFQTYAVLTVGAAQVPGAYAGTYNVTVQYQ